MRGEETCCIGVFPTSICNNYIRFMSCHIVVMCCWGAACVVSGVVQSMLYTVEENTILIH